MSVGPADGLRAALEAPVGARLEQVFHSPFVTVLLAERDGGEDSLEALEFARDALTRRGVAAGRQMVLLASMQPPQAAHRLAVRAMRERLGIPVVLHDPAHSPSMPATGESDLQLELDDELREAEAVMLVSALRPGAEFGEGGGEELLVPGSVSAATAARCRPLAASVAGRRRIARIAQSACRIDYALLWWRGGSVRAWAGEMPAVLDHARASLPPLASPPDDAGSAESV